MPKKTFLHTPHVKITDEYAIFNPNWKVNIKDVNAIFITRQATNRRYPILLALFCFITGGLSEITYFYIAGFFCLVWAFILIKTRYLLRIKIGRGEIRPIYSTNIHELEDIKEAMERAMLYNEEEEYENEINILPSVTTCDI